MLLSLFPPSRRHAVRPALWVAVLGLALALSLQGCSPTAAPTSVPKATPADTPSRADTPDAETSTIAAVQGSDHRSPKLGRNVTVQGVVTAVAPRPRQVFIQSLEPDSDPATSEGLCVKVEDPDAFSVGRELRVTGRVEESARRDNQLPITCIAATEVQALGAATLPEPVRIGKGGLAVPSQVDDDGLTRFEPAFDAVDFFESLEGMRVRLDAPRVIGPTSRFGDLAVWIGDEAPAATPRGGLLQSATPPTQRLILTGDAGFELASVDVGTSLNGDVVGTLTYGFGGYRLMATEPLTIRENASLLQDPTELKGSETRLSIGTFNVLNLSLDDSDDKFRRLAEVAVQQMGAPDILCLQEVQDDTGRTDDGVVSAEKTLARLIDTIVALGGPRYRARALDPVNNQEGGAPGSNIRVAYLYDPDRVDAVGPLYRVDDPAFSRETAPGWSNTRRPLVDTFRFRGHDLHLIGLHLRSKGGDDPIFGAVQPPIRHSELQRTRQAEVVRAEVDRLFDRDPDARVVVLGDLNERSGRPPLDALTRDDLGSRALEDLILRLAPEERYTYVFQGEAGVLDHILIGGALRRADVEVDVVHCCSDVAADRQAGDHDPIVMTVELP